MTVYDKILQMPKPAYFCLIDPDKTSLRNALDIVVKAQEIGVDGILVGSSMLLSTGLNEYIKELKNVTDIPIMIFPGLLNTISESADAILFLNMISSRNPQLLIGEQVRAAPFIKRHNLEAISTAYILIESGNLTTVQYVSNSFPIPANKPDIVIAHCLAAEIIGMKLVYLEAGSGAVNPVSDEIIKSVKNNCKLPVIVGGGIKTAETAYNKAKAGADVIVTGTVLEIENNIKSMTEICEKVHSLRK